MTLHRTPVHHEALGLIRRGRVMWREARCSKKPDGVPRMSPGFAYASGGRLDLEMLVALYELRQSKLLDVDGGVVLLTSTGRMRLSEWDATRAGRPS